MILMTIEFSFLSKMNMNTSFKLKLYNYMVPFAISPLIEVSDLIGKIPRNKYSWTT